MKQCNVCDKDADIKCDGLYFCMEHYHEWAFKQSKAVFDWEVVR